MHDPSLLYPTLIQASRNAFAQKHFMVAYHSLSGAMYCALNMQSSQKLEEVVGIAYEQIDELNEELGGAAFPDEPMELSLYRSLIQVARTRLLLFRK